MRDQQLIDLRSVMVQTFIEAVENGTELAIVVSDSTSTSQNQTVSGAISGTID